MQLDDKYLFFDLDDTLIKCSGYYYDIEEFVADKFLEYCDTYSKEELRNIFNERQWKNVEKHGYGPENFTISLMQVGGEVIGYDFYKYKLADFIEEQTKILFDSPIELIDGVEETIKDLHDKGYKMSIITKGLEEVQTKRVQKLKIKELFNGYEIVKHKTKDDYLDILNRYKLDASNCYMIGNSTKGDINEAKLAGFNTIYIPNEQTWNYENEEILSCEPETKVLSNITEILTLFKL